MGRQSFTPRRVLPPKRVGGRRGQGGSTPPPPENEITTTAGKNIVTSYGLQVRTTEE